MSIGRYWRSRQGDKPQGSSFLELRMARIGIAFQNPQLLLQIKGRLPFSVGRGVGGGIGLDSDNLVL